MKLLFSAPTVRPTGRGFLPLALVLSGLLLAALPGRSGTLDRAHIKETKFPSGLQLLVKEDHATDLASIQVWIRAGGFQEDERTSGTAHVIEHLLFKGPEGTSPDDRIENLGGLLEATTEKDWTRITCTVAGRYAQRATETVADTLLRPRFTEEDLQAEKPLILEELNQANFNPEAALSRAIYALAFKKHPYRYDVRGTARQVQELTLARVKEFYRRHFIPANMTVVVVGDVDAVGVERAVRTAFQADRPSAGSGPEKLPEPERACSEKAHRVLQGAFQGAYVGVAFPAPSVKDEPDVYAMDLLLTLLEDSQTGRLPRLLRGVAGAQATFETRRQPGLMVIMAATSPDRMERVEGLILKELEHIANDPLPAAELAAAKAALRGSYASDNETYSGQGGSLGYYAAIDSWQFAVNYLAKVEAVTPEHVREVARKYFDPERSVTVLLAPRVQPQQPRPQSGT